MFGNRHKSNAQAGREGVVRIHDTQIAAVSTKRLVVAGQREGNGSRQRGERGKSTSIVDPRGIINRPPVEVPNRRGAGRSDRIRARWITAFVRDRAAQNETSGMGPRWATVDRTDRRRGTSRQKQAPPYLIIGETTTKTQRDRSPVGAPATTHSRDAQRSTTTTTENRPSAARCSRW